MAEGRATALTKRWAGRAWGTNVGNLFVMLEGEDAALTGTLRMNEEGVGIVVYAIQGSFDPPTLILTGQPSVEIEGAEFGQLNVTDILNSQGELQGEWKTTVQSAGTFVLYPHSGSEQTADDRQAAQLHTARHNFGAIEIDREHCEGNISGM